MVQRGMEIGDALNTYTLLTIGDGLVTQIPALLMAASSVKLRTTFFPAPLPNVRLPPGLLTVRSPFLIIFSRRTCRDDAMAPPIAKSHLSILLTVFLSA